MGAFVQAAEEGVVVPDVPEAVGDFLEADVLVIEGLTQEVLAGLQAKGAAPLALRTSVAETEISAGKGVPHSRAKLAVLGALRR